jgi:hypothetical protein
MRHPARNRLPRDWLTGEGALPSPHPSQKG